MIRHFGVVLALYAHDVRLWLFARSCGRRRLPWWTVRPRRRWSRGF
jgi:hypothetical protein